MIKLLESTSSGHRFLQDGKTYAYPRVTTIIRELGFADYSKARKADLEAGRLRGSFVHLACQFLDENDLDEGTVKPEHIPYLEGWKLFRQEVAWARKKPVHRELLVASHLWQYAGKLDAIFPGGILLDIKTGVMDELAVRLQLALYQMAAKSMGLIIKRRFCINLKPGTYRMHDFTIPSDITAAHAAILLYKFKKGG